MQFLYSLSYGSRAIVRNRNYLFTNIVMSALVTTMVSILFRTYFVVSKIIADKNPTESPANATNDFSLLVRVLQISSLIMLLAFFVLGFAYYLSVYSKNFIMNKESITTARYIGVSSSYLAREFFFESFIPFSLTAIAGISLVRWLYNQVIENADANLKLYLIQPHYFTYSSDLLVLGSIIVLFLALYIFTRFKIHSI